MSVVIVTNVGEMRVRLFTEEFPVTCCNFLKLCKLKYYHWCIFHNVQRDFIAQTGDPTGSGQGGVRYQAVTDEETSPYFLRERGRVEGGPGGDGAQKAIKRHTQIGLLSMVGVQRGTDVLCGSQFFITLTGRPLVSLDAHHTVFGELLLPSADTSPGADPENGQSSIETVMVKGMETLRRINAAPCDEKGRPLIDIYIQRTIVLEDPFPDPVNFPHINRSPPPTVTFKGQRRPEPEEGKTPIMEAQSEEERRARERREETRSLAISLEMLGERRSADLQAPDNVLFVCRLNPLTQAEDLQTIFARFGPVTACEMAKDRVTGTSLGYAFVTFGGREAAEAAYLKMNNVIIDDRRIKVDFCHSVRQRGTRPRRPDTNTTATTANQGEESRNRVLGGDEDRDRDRDGTRDIDRDRDRVRSRTEYRDRDGDRHRYRDRDRHSYGYRERDHDRDRKDYGSDAREHRDHNDRRLDRGHYSRGPPSQRRSRSRSR